MNILKRVTPIICSYFSVTWWMILRRNAENYCNDHNDQDIPSMWCNNPKIWTIWFHCRVMCPIGSDRIANIVVPDQTAPLGAVWSGSTIFANALLSNICDFMVYLLMWSFTYYLQQWQVLMNVSSPSFWHMQPVPGLHHNSSSVHRCPSAGVPLISLLNGYVSEGSGCSSYGCTRQE